MAYNVNDPTLLKHLLDLGTRIKDVTDDHGTRLGNLESVGAEKNVIVGIQVNDTDVAPDANRKVNITIPAVAEYSVKKLDTASEGASASYQLTKDNVGVGAVINIPKDMVVSSGTVEIKSESGAWGEAGTYLVLTLANATSDKVYINVSTLIEYVTSGSQTGDMVFITVDPTTHQVTATITDGTIPLTKLTTEAQGVISGKADKAVPAASGNFAALDANGNLTDSGKKASDFLTEHQSLDGKLDKLTGATENEIVLVGANGAVKSSGVDFATDTEVAEALETIFPTTSNG